MYKNFTIVIATNNNFIDIILIKMKIIKKIIKGIN